jgi:hypothetical protein
MLPVASTALGLERRSSALKAELRRPMAKANKMRPLNARSLVEIDAAQRRALSKLEKKWETKVSAVRETIRETERLGEEDYSIRINTKG